MPKKALQRAEDLRRALAQEAARIMATSSRTSAKGGGADRLGVNDNVVLPKNIETGAALRAHQRLKRSDSHGVTLKE